MPRHDEPQDTVLKGRAKRTIVAPTRIHTTKRGVWLLRHAATNKGLAFSLEERHALGLRGLLPHQVATIEEQVERELEHVRAKPTSLEQYIGLMALQDRNRVLFYRLLVEHLEELMPIVYTPTVGRACQLYSHIFRGPRGLWLTPDDIDDMAACLRNTPTHDVRLAVVTDNERILGLGDQGAGGMGIPIGKLSLYIAGGGIHPSNVLPISLDVGTDNRALLDDPLYMGYRRRRLTGTAYDRFIESFVEAMREVFPHAVIQWEDFHKRHAFDLLDRYRHRVPSFDDDIQGTAAVVLGGILAFLRQTGTRLVDHRFLFVGAGQACSGTAELVRSSLRGASEPGAAIARAIVMLDSQGIVRSDRPGLEPYKHRLAASPEVLSFYGLSDERSLQHIIAQMKPTVLLAATGTPNLFTQPILQELAAHCPRPLVMILSNPTSKAECTPEQAIHWTGGKAVVATGSPFAPVDYCGRTHIIGQANNMFIFPGAGLGIVLSELAEVPDQIFAIASQTLADAVPESRLRQNALYPEIADLRAVSARIAAAIVRYGSEHYLGRRIPVDQIDTLVRDSMWYPDYVPVVPMPTRPDSMGGDNDERL